MNARLNNKSRAKPSTFTNNPSMIIAAIIAKTADSIFDNISCPVIFQKLLNNYEYTLFSVFFSMNIT